MYKLINIQKLDSGFYGKRYLTLPVMIVLNSMVKNLASINLDFKNPDHYKNHIKIHKPAKIKHIGE